MNFQRFKQLLCGGALCIGALIAARVQASTIIYSARYYSPPNTYRTSHAHLYAIDERGGKPRQLTFGNMDDVTVRTSPDGKTLAFERMHADDNSEICVLDVKTRRVTTVLKLAKDSSIELLQWAPMGKTLSVQRDADESNGNIALYLIDIPSLKTRRFANVRDWAWRPQSTQIRLSDDKNTRLFDTKTGRETPLDAALSETIWLNHNECASVVTKHVDNDGDFYDRPLKSVDIFGLNGQKLRSVAPKSVQGIVKTGTDSDGMDGAAIELEGRARVMPLPYQSRDLMLVANESTSSGVSLAFTRFDAQSGQIRFLARGTWLRWASGAKRFAVVDYHDTTPYDTLPNGHKRVVYTTRLLVGDGKGALRPIVSGLVLVRSCDWSR